MVSLYSLSHPRSGLPAVGPVTYTPLPTPGSTNVANSDTTVVPSGFRDPTKLHGNPMGGGQVQVDAKGNPILVGPVAVDTKAPNSLEGLEDLNYSALCEKLQSKAIPSAEWWKKIPDIGKMLLAFNFGTDEHSGIDAYTGVYRNHFGAGDRLDDREASLAQQLGLTPVEYAGYMALRQFNEGYVDADGRSHAGWKTPTPNPTGGTGTATGGTGTTTGQKTPLPMPQRKSTMNVAIVVVGAGLVLYLVTRG